MPPRKFIHVLRGRAAWVGIITVAVLLMFAISGSAQTQRPNGAGLVVQHGDGTLIYVYVPFEEESISAEELLTRSALALEVDVFGGLGMAVCSLNGEGCPSDDCFCHSYSDPATFWHYYTWSGEGWAEHPLGVSTRMLADGDIDGWSWNAGDHNLPSVSIDEIASLNGFDRNPPEPTATETPTATPPPQPTATNTLTATAIPAPTVTSPPQITAPPTQLVVATSAATATSTRGFNTPTVAPPPTLAAAIPATAAPTATLTAESTSAPTKTQTATPTSQPGSQAAAVIVTPGAAPQPLPVADQTASSSRTTFVVFAAVLGILAVIGIALIYRGRLRST